MRFEQIQLFGNLFNESNQKCLRQQPNSETTKNKKQIITRIPLVYFSNYAKLKKVKFQVDISTEEILESPMDDKDRIFLAMELLRDVTDDHMFQSAVDHILTNRSHRILPDFWWKMYLQIRGKKSDN